MMTDIRTAILKAADHIERHPDLWNFQAQNVNDCETPACALGWIGFFLEMHGATNCEVCKVLTGSLSTMDFYKSFAELDGQVGLAAAEPQYIPTMLREYADKYHPAAIPESVRAIFDGNVVIELEEAE